MKKIGKSVLKTKKTKPKTKPLQLNDIQVQIISIIAKRDKQDSITDIGDIKFDFDTSNIKQPPLSLWEEKIGKDIDKNVHILVKNNIIEKGFGIVGQGRYGLETFEATEKDFRDSSRRWRRYIYKIADNTLAQAMAELI